MKAYCLTQSIQLCANNPSLCATRQFQSPSLPLNTFSCVKIHCRDILDRFNFTRIKVSWHNAGRVLVADRVSPLCRIETQTSRWLLLTRRGKRLQSVSGTYFISLIRLRSGRSREWRHCACSDRRRCVAGDQGMLFARTETSVVWVPE